MTSRSRRLVAAAASTVLLGLGAAACAGGGDGGQDDSRGSSMPAAADADQAGNDAVAAPEAARSVADTAADGSAEVATTDDSAAQTSGGGSTAQEEEPLEVTDGRSLIKQGNVALSSTDVGDTLFDIGKIVRSHGGEVSDDDTQADAKGQPKTALLTLRVPVDKFDDALAELKALKTDGAGVRLISATSTTEDVTSKVVDTDVRVELQKRSIERISLLLDRATSIRDVVSIERELASREADLGSLERRQKALADQVSLSTITVSVERPAKQAATTQPKDDDSAGFLAGLEGGWKAFREVTTGLLTGAGALLPFAALALLVGVPLRVWLRRRPARPATPGGTPDAPAAA